MDLVAVDADSFSVDAVRRTQLPVIVGISLISVLMPVFYWVYLQKRKKSTLEEEPGLRLPKEITPISAVVTLQRFAREYASQLNPEDHGRLKAEIVDLEKKYFASEGKIDPLMARDTLKRWHKRLGGTSTI